MAVPGRRGSVPTDLIVATRDAPLPWGSGFGTLRALPRNLRFSTPVLEPPGSDMMLGVCMDEWARGLVPQRASPIPVRTPTWSTYGRMSA